MFHEDIRKDHDGLMNELTELTEQGEGPHVDLGILEMKYGELGDR